VWIQLLRHLSPEAALPSNSAEVQPGSSAAGAGSSAAGAELSQAQPAGANVATTALAEELAASSLAD
jgi:hypothetical protein